MKIPLLLFLIALTIRLAAILFWQFDGLYGQDAYAYYQQAVAISHNLPRGQPPPTDFFWPNGYPLLIAVFMDLVGQSPLAGQLAALLCGALLAPLAYLLSRDLWEAEQLDEVVENRILTMRSELAGSLAGLIIATAGQPILSSVVVMADMPALFWAALAAWGVVRATGQAVPPAASRYSGPDQTPGEATPRGQDRYSGRRSGGWFLAAGAALALAIISRWLYVLITPALALYTIFKICRQQAPRWPPSLAVLSGLIILSPQLWLSLNKPEGLLHNWLLGWRFLNFFQRQFETADGYAVYRLPVAIFYAQPAGHPAYIFPLLGLAAGWGLWRLWQTKSWGALILLLGWAGPVYLFLAGIPYQNFRFGLTLYLPLVILTGFGLSDRLREEARRRGNGGAEEQGRRGAGEQRRRGSEEARKRRSGGAEEARKRGSGGAEEAAKCRGAEEQGSRGAEERRSGGGEEAKERGSEGAEERGYGLFSSGWLCSRVLTAMIVLSLVGMLAWAYPMLDNFLTAQNQSKAIARRVEQTLPPGATLLTFGLTLTLQHYTRLDTRELFYFDPPSLQDLIETKKPIYLLLDLGSIETQWQGKSPYLNYRWLGENTTLREMKRFPPYVLFKIEQRLGRG